jgi:hypothetical protein
VANDEAVKACRETAINVTVLLPRYRIVTSTQVGEECQLNVSAVSHQEMPLVPRVSMDMLKKLGNCIQASNKTQIIHIANKVLLIFALHQLYESHRATLTK